VTRRATLRVGRTQPDRRPASRHDRWRDLSGTVCLRLARHRRCPGRRRRHRDGLSSLRRSDPCSDDCR
jgi:hypothetical protein